MKNKLILCTVYSLDDAREANVLTIIAGKALYKQK